MTITSIHTMLSILWYLPITIVILYMTAYVMLSYIYILLGWDRDEGDNIKEHVNWIMELTPHHWDPVVNDIPLKVKFFNTYTFNFSWLFWYSLIWVITGTLMSFTIVDQWWNYPITWFSAWYHLITKISISNQYVINIVWAGCVWFMVHCSVRAIVIAMSTFKNRRNVQ